MLSVNSILGSSVGAADKAAGGLADNFETFLSLLTTQLQNQDPLDPMESGEFTNQLVAFSGVEQSIKQNKNLENLATLTAFNGINSAVGFIGKDIIAEQSEVNLENGQATWLYELANKSVDTKLVIRDEAGKVVHQEPGNLDAGAHDFVWDGTDVNGNVMAPDGVDFNGGDAMLDAGGFAVPISSVLSVRPSGGAV